MTDYVNNNGGWDGVGLAKQGCVQDKGTKQLKEGGKHGIISAETVAARIILMQPHSTNLVIPSNLRYELPVLQISTPHPPAQLKSTVPLSDNQSRRSNEEQTENETTHAMRKKSNRFRNEEASKSLYRAI
jgi:hypothetical protein